jgi:hypothetical protein
MGKGLFDIPLQIEAPFGHSIEDHKEDLCIRTFFQVGPLIFRPHCVLN